MNWDEQEIAEKTEKVVDDGERANEDAQSLVRKLYVWLSPLSLVAGVALLLAPLPTPNIVWRIYGVTILLLGIAVLLAWWRNYQRSR